MNDQYRPVPAGQPSPAEIAAWLNGELKQADKAPAVIQGLATLADAQLSDISFVAGDKAAKAASGSQAGLLIVSPKHDFPDRAVIVVAEVWLAVAQLMNKLYPTPAPPAEVHPTAVLGRDVKIGAGVSVGPCCVVGDGCELADGVVLGPHCILDAGCQLGANTRLAARVTLMGPVQIGARCIVHPGVVIGADGFKFEVVQGAPLKIPQIGTVIVEDDVEIGANTTIDRAFLNETRIGRGCKIDNLVQIAHNCQIGPGCIMAAQVGISGSCKLGKGCLLGGSVGLRDGLTIGDGVMIGARSGVHTDWPSGSVIMGVPAMPMKEFWKVSAASIRLPEYARRLKGLEQKIQSLAPQDETPETTE